MYIGVSEIGLPEELLIRLTDDEGTGSVNQQRAEAAIAGAQAVVDSMLARRYEVPFTEAPAAAKKLTADLAANNLYARVGSVPEYLEKAREEAMALLEAIASGKAAIVTVGNGLPGFSGSGREFSREYMAGF